MEDLLIKKKCIDMIEYGMIALRHYPKYEKHVLAEDTRNAMYELLRLIVICNKRYYKKTTMQEVDVQLDMVRNFVRLAVDFKYIDLHKYEVWSTKLDELGRMIGGWIKSVQK